MSPPPSFVTYLLLKDGQMLVQEVHPLNCVDLSRAPFLGLEKAIRAHINWDAKEREGERGGKYNMMMIRK